MIGYYTFQLIKGFFVAIGLVVTAAAVFVTVAEYWR